MKSTIKALPLSIAWASLFAIHGVSAQSIIDTANDKLDQEDPASEFGSGQLAPVLYDGELEDIGPQFLLISGQKPAHDWFRALFDVQWFNSTNPTLAEDSDRRSADIIVGTAQLGALTPDYKIADGEANVLAGYRYQLFEYGNVTGDVIINGLPVSRSDFRGHTLFSDGKWTKGDWRASAGLRYTRLDNQVSGDNFYNEFVVSWGLSRNFAVHPDALLTIAYDGSAFITESAAGSSFFRDDFNDRLSNALSARLLCRINSKLFLQPSIRLNYSDYSDDPNGEREDLTFNVGTTLSYYFTSDLVARVFVSYQKRGSNGVGIADYSNIDGGIGGSLSFKF